MTANIVKKEWNDIWGCAKGENYIKYVPEPCLNTEKAEPRHDDIEPDNEQSGPRNSNQRSARPSLFMTIVNSLLRSSRSRSRQGRILHSDPAGRTDFPYVVSIVNLNVEKEGDLSRSTTGRRVCAGAIIDSRHIVTAASCVSG
jgi:hypothetical protein